jgi:hypothetical protein
MDPMKKRLVLFLAGCIPTRLVLALLSKTYYKSELINFIGIFTLLVGLGFFTIFFLGLRKTGLETGGSPIWWNNLRPLHGTLYLMATWFIFFGKREYAWIPLAFDVSIGLFAFLVKHVNNLHLLVK